jgi:hypothetical protein
VVLGRALQHALAWVGEEIFFQRAPKCATSDKKSTPPEVQTVVDRVQSDMPIGLALVCNVSNSYTRLGFCLPLLVQTAVIGITGR